MRRMLKCRLGAASAEYALILAVVGVAIGGAMLLLAQVTSDSIMITAGKIDQVSDGA